MKSMKAATQKNTCKERQMDPEAAVIFFPLKLSIKFSSYLAAEAVGQL